MAKNYFIIGLCIALAICIWFLWQPDKQHDIHDNDKKEVVATNDSLKAHDAIAARKIDSIRRREDSLVKVNTQLREGQSLTRRQLDLKNAELRTAVSQIKAINKDTGYISRLIDSLEGQVNNLTYLIHQYEQYADSINIVNDSLRVAVTAKDKEKDTAKAELQAAYDKLYKEYMQLFDTSRDLMKSLKRQKLKTKVAAVLGAAGAVLLIVK